MAARYISGADLRWVGLESGGSIHPGGRRADNCSHGDLDPLTDSHSHTNAHCDTDSNSASALADICHGYPVTLSPLGVM